jgi:hypothetical protein
MTRSPAVLLAVMVSVWCVDDRDQLLGGLRAEEVAFGLIRFSQLSAERLDRICVWYERQ